MANIAGRQERSFLHLTRALTITAIQMAQEVNIYQLLGACTSLDVHFSSDVEDEVDGYRDAQSKLELAQQLESDLHDPEGEWETLSRTISQVLDSAGYIDRLADNANRLGREEAEAAADDDSYKVWSAMLQSNPMQKGLMERQKGTAERDNTIKTMLFVLSDMKRKQDKQDERIQGLQADLEADVQAHKGCNQATRSLQQQLDAWKDHGDCAAKMSAMEADVQAHEGCNQAIQSLKQQQLDAGKVHGESEKKIWTFERDIKSLYNLVIQIINVDVKRTDEDAKAKYEALVAKLQSWTGENIGTPSADPARKASFRDLVRSLFLNYDYMVKYHRNTIDTLHRLTADVTALHDTLKVLRQDRDEWKDNCMAIVAKLDANEEAAKARESALSKSIQEREAMILDLHQMIEEDLDSS